MRIGRILALIGALGVVTVLLSACDTSPVAANVNGHAISVAYLENQLKQWSSNHVWVTSFDSANSKANGGNGLTVAGSGGSGTYSSTFAAGVLDTVIEYDIINDYLSSHGKTPSQDEMVAARAVNEFLRSDYWDQFSPALRQFLVDQLAAEAALTPVSTDQTTIQSAFSQVGPLLFSQICFDQASASSRSAALAITDSGTVNGANVCLDQAQVEGEPSGFQTALIGLTPGDISKPIAVPFGFAVLQLVSKKSPELSTGVQQVLSAATATTLPTAISDLIVRAHVKLNPEFGTWSNGQITPPRSLSSS